MYHNTAEEKNCKKGRTDDAKQERLGMSPSESLPCSFARKHDGACIPSIGTSDTTMIHPNIHEDVANVAIDELACESQKVRALDLWRDVTACPGFQIEQNVVKRIKESLSIGVVPPVFHAYSLQYKRWVDIQQGRDDYDRLSSRSNELLFDLSNLSTREASIGVAKAYEAEFCVPTCGGFVSTLLDEANQVARQRVEDFQMSWMFDSSLTREVCRLVNTGAAMVGEDVEVTPVDSDFKIGCVHGGNTSNLITRRLSRGVVASCFNLPENGTRYIAGSPGIGKSWTLIYALQQALLYNGSCVLFFTPIKNSALLCVRQDDKVFAWKAHTSLEKAYSWLFDHPNVLVLLDPEPAGTNFSRGHRRLISAAPYDAKHFGKEHLNLSGVAIRYLNPFTEAEACVALPYMVQAGKFNKNAVLYRAQKVGFLPRWLLCEEKANERVRAFYNAMYALPHGQGQLELILKSDGQSNEAYGKILPVSYLLLLHHRKYSMMLPFVLLTARRTMTRMQRMQMAL